MALCTHDADDVTASRSLPVALRYNAPAHSSHVKRVILARVSLTILNYDLSKNGMSN